MLKKVLTACCGVLVLFLGGVQTCSGDIEDRFINPDFQTAKNIFIDVRDVSLLNVLKIFSKQSGLSFIAAQDVADKRITLYLNKVPLNQAMQIILDANDLTYEIQGGSSVFFVKAKPKEVKILITKVYQLKYATVSSSKLNSTISVSGQESSSGSQTQSSGIEQVIKDSLSPDGKVVQDTRTNSLVITDAPAQFEIIDKTIAKLDVPVPQVLIEVEMLDVSKSVADSIGITYGATPLTFTGGTFPTNFPFGPNATSSSSSDSSGSSSSSSSSTESVTTGWNANGLTAAIHFLTTTTDARTLARPSILTLNNETAKIEISTDQAISIQQVSSSTTAGSSTNSITPERFTTGVILKVTPQANLLTREVTMAVSPKVIDVVLSQVQPSDTAVNGQIFDPETRGSDSILKLKDGQSMVIGGLMRTTNNKSVKKLPFLGDLPVIGAAFRSTDKTKTERELIIFLTPHIIDDTNSSTLKNLNSSSVAYAQDASNRAQEITSSLDTFEMQKY